MEYALVAIGLAFAVAIGFSLARSRHVKLETQLEERARQHEATKANLNNATQSAQQLRERLSSAEAEVSRYESILKERERADVEHRERLESQFKNLASGVLKATTAEFRQQAADQFKQQREHASTEFQAREAAIAGLTQPIKEGLEALRNHVDQSDKERSTASARMHDQVERMISETTLLRDVLHNPQLRGQWGEQSLQNMLEVSGMQKHVDYVSQPSLKADGTSLRPDVVVRIPGGIKVVIDAKTPHDMYNKAVKSKDKEERLHLLRQHAAALNSHAKDLGTRNYSRWTEGSPEFVIMYVPTDPMLDAAMEAIPEIWQDAMQRHKVLIATPGLLIAFLRTVAMAWQQESIQKNAQEIADAATELYKRLGTFAEHLGQVGSSLNKAVTHYNRSVASFDKRLLVQAQRLEQYGVSGKAGHLDPVERTASTPKHLSEPSAAIQHLAS